MCGAVVRIEGERALNLLFGPRPIPVILCLDHGHSNMRPGILLIQLERFYCCSFRLRHRFSRRNMEVRKETPARRQPLIGRGGVRVPSHSASVVLNSFPDFVIRPLSEVKVPLEFEPVDFNTLPHTDFQPGSGAENGSNQAQPNQPSLGIRWARWTIAGYRGGML